jgi:alginate O-acetyltransferase complex protein AlgJ
MFTSRLSAYFFLAFLVLGGLAALWAFVPAANETDKMGLAGWVKGGQTLAFEKKFDEHMAHYDASINLWGTLGYALFREGKKGAVVGQGGWIFTSEEFDQPKNFADEIKAKTDYIVKVRDLLKARNISLLVAPVPAKARVYRQYLAKYPYPSYWETQYADFVSSLRAAGVPALDLVPVLSSPNIQTYLKTDTHWTPEGARLAAQAIAASVASAYPYLSYPHTAYQAAKKSETEHRGDLLRYVALKPFEKQFGVMPDQLNVYQFTAQPSSDSAASNGDDLFGETSVPVTLVGTSYSANKNWPFADFLKESLQTDLVNAADEGMGPFDVMQKYLKSDAFKTTPPQLLIWEIPERYLPVHYDLTMETP